MHDAMDFLAVLGLAAMVAEDIIASHKLWLRSVGSDCFR